MCDCDCESVVGLLDLSFFLSSEEKQNTFTTFGFRSIISRELLSKSRISPTGPTPILCLASCFLRFLVLLRCCLVVVVLCCLRPDRSLRPSSRLSMSMLLFPSVLRVASRPLYAAGRELPGSGYCICISMWIVDFINSPGKSAKGKGARTQKRPPPKKPKQPLSYITYGSFAVTYEWRMRMASTGGEVEVEILRNEERSTTMRGAKTARCAVSERRVWQRKQRTAHMRRPRGLERREACESQGEWQVSGR